jgi:tetratricopeptide (TPR) repeat protein
MAFLLALRAYFYSSNSVLADLEAGDYLQRANAERHAGDLESASTDYTEAIRLEDSNGAFYLLRGACRFEQKQWDEATADFRKAQELQPASQQRVPLLIWAARMLSGEKKTAMAELKQRVHGEMIAAAKKSPTPFPLTASNGFDNAAAVFNKGRPPKAPIGVLTESEWILATERFLIGQIKEADFFSMDPPPTYGDSSGRRFYRPAKTHSCEALFYAALKRLGSGDRKSAVNYMRQCATADGPKDSLEREFAETVLEAQQGRQ